MSTLLQDDFIKAELEDINSLFLSLSGHDNTGKTHFGLSAPGAIALFNLDRGLKGVIEKFLIQGKDIQRLNVNIPRPKTDNVLIEKDGKKFLKNVQVVDKDVMDQAQESLQQVINLSRKAMVNDAIRTLFYDTGTALWELWRVARFGKILQVPASAYPPVNAEFVGFCNELKDSGKNIIMTHQMRPVYIDDKKTNRFEAAQFSKMDYISDVSIRTSYDSEENEFSYIITRCKAHPELQWDDDIPYDMLHDFPTMGQLVVDDTTVEDWE